MLEIKDLDGNPLLRVESETLVCADLKRRKLRRGNFRGQDLSGADLDHAYVRYVRVDLDGSIVSQVVGCRSGWASIAVLPGDQPVVQFTSLALVETLLAFGPP